MAEGSGFEDFFLFRLGAETAYHFHSDGITGHALAERVEVLLREYGRRHEQRNLAAALDRFKGGADGDLGLPETDVSADESIHRARALHVGLGFGDGAELVAGFRVGKGTFKFFLPRCIRRTGETRLGFALGVDAE